MFQFFKYKNTTKQKIRLNTFVIYLMSFSLNAKLTTPFYQWTNSLKSLINSKFHSQINSFINYIFTRLIKDSLSFKTPKRNLLLWSISKNIILISKPLLNGFMIKSINLKSNSSNPSTHKKKELKVNIYLLTKINSSINFLLSHGPTPKNYNKSSKPSSKSLNKWKLKDKVVVSSLSIKTKKMNFKSPALIFLTIHSFIFSITILANSE